jgi:hypothetical protein
VKGSHAVIASPYDWSTAATPITSWIGGHSQRGDNNGSTEPIMRSLFQAGTHPQAIAGMRIIAEESQAYWHVRLHERSVVHYSSHLMSLIKSDSQSGT